MTETTMRIHTIQDEKCPFCKRKVRDNGHKRCSEEAFIWSKVLGVEYLETNNRGQKNE